MFTQLLKSGIARLSLLASVWTLIYYGLHLVVTGKWLGFFISLVILFCGFSFYFTLSSVLYAFSYHRGFKWSCFLLSFGYIFPLVQVEHFKSYQEFMTLQNMTLLIREPEFLLSVILNETTFELGLKGFIIWGLAAFLNYFTLFQRGKVCSFRGRFRPLFMFTHKYGILLTLGLLSTQIFWCWEHKWDQTMSRPLYPFFVVGLVSTMIFVWVNGFKKWKKALVTLVTIFTLSSMILSNKVYSNSKNYLTFDMQFYHSLFSTIFFIKPFTALSLSPVAKEKYQKVKTQQLDYNVLILLHDALRIDALSSSGYHRPTDDILKPFYEKSFGDFYFEHPISITNYTLTTVPALFTGIAADQPVRNIKDNLRLWDYYAKSASTFFISTQDTTWTKLDQFYKSEGLHYIWSTIVDTDTGLHEDKADDRISHTHLLKHLAQLPKRFFGVWQTNASHWAYIHPEEFDIYQPCDLSRKEGPTKVRNCYDNAVTYLSHLTQEILDKVDLERTVIIITSDHGEGFNEHGIYFHKEDYHTEFVTVPFIWYIPPLLLNKIPAEKLKNFTLNQKRVVSSVDLVPTLLELHKLVSGSESLTPEPKWSGKSLFSSDKDRTVFSTRCFPGYNCSRRDILFVNKDYSLIFRPSNQEQPIWRLYRTDDLKQLKPLDYKNLLLNSQFKDFIMSCGEAHPFGRFLIKTVYP